MTPSTEETPSRLHWFAEARYGMFVHFGPYAVGGRGEWIMNRERIGKDEYQRLYAERFTAERFDPEDLAGLARDAGMGYLVLTTRHHDGFCLWNTRTTDWNAVRIGPGRDLVGPYVQAAREAGLKVGFYYSGADWTHPDYPGAYERDWPRQWRDDASRERFHDYMAAQLRELLTGYGPIDLLWYDGCIPAMDGARMNAMVRELQPGILINERMGEPYDFQCAEQAIKPRPGPWEACMTLNDSWGYHAGDHDWKSPREVVRMLITCARSAGNLLLNVGPRGDGSIPQPSRDILLAAGQWVRTHKACLSHSSRSGFSWFTSGTITTRGSTAYLHLFHSPGPELRLCEIANKVLSARRVADGAEVSFEQTADRLTLRGLPVPLPDPLCTTIALKLEGEPQPLRPQTTFWIPE